MDKRFLIKLILAGYLLFLGLLLAVKAQSASQIALKSYSSVVLLVMEDSAGQPLSLGSGFFVKQDIVATNFHVIEGAIRGYAKIVGKEAKYDVTGIVGIDNNRDLVLLKISGANAPPLLFGDSDKITVGDDIYVISNPMGLEGSLSKGIVSGIRQIEGDTLLQITASISPGSSGGPVLNIKGEVIGIAVAAFKEGQNLNFAIPSSYLIPLISRIASVTLLSTISSTKRQKSILDNFGGRGTEGATAGTMIWTSEYACVGEYSFSIKNNLQYPIKDVYCLVVFYDKYDNPIEVDLVHLDGVIPSGLAKRVNSRVHESVQELNTTPQNRHIPNGRVEFRILDFKIVK